MKNLPNIDEVINNFDDLFYLSPNEPEFLAYSLIIESESNRRLVMQQKLQSYPKEILESKEIQFALKIISAIRKKNYAEFFKLLQKADYLTACVMSKIFKQIRIEALQLLSKVSQLALYVNN